MLCFRFRCMLTTMAQKPANVDSIVLAACTLHNVMRTRYPGRHAHHFDREDPVTHDMIPGAWRDDDATLTALQGMRGNNATQGAKGQRDYLRAYYNSEAGSVPWQERMV